MNISSNILTPMATQVYFDQERMHVRLKDDREISVPLSWFPRLQQASSEQQQQWELLGGGAGIHWEEIDEDISVPILLGLPCE